MNPNTIDAGGMQPRRVGSIIPAVPRMFERRLGQAKVPRDVRSTASNAVIPEKMVEVSLEKSVCHKPQDLHIEVSGQSEKEDSEQQEIETSPRQEGTDHSASSLAQNLGFEKHGSDLPLPSSPRVSLQTAISTGPPPTHERGNILPQSADTTTEDNDSSKGHQKVNANGPTPPSHLYIPPGFQTYPNASTNAMTSATPSSYKAHNSSQSVSFHAQQTPFAEPLPSPTHSSVLSGGHLRDLSFQAHTCLSPNRKCSPTHSVYQGYTYGPPQQPHSFHQAQINDHPLPGQLRDSGQYHYGQLLPFNALGNQPPLTPSATPFDLTPKQWSSQYGSHPSVSSVYDDKPFAPAAAVGPEHPHPPRSIHISENPCVSTTKLGTEETTQALESTLLPKPHHDTTMFEGKQGLGGPDQPPILEYLLRNFNVDEYADCRLLVVHDADTFKPISLSLHRILVARSPTLRHLLKKRGECRENDVTTHLSLRLTDRFITPSAIEAALRTCYGVPASSFTGKDTGVMPTKSKSKDEFSISWMKESLAFAATGHLLQLEEVVLRGLEIASKILNWENLENALSFALESGLHREHNAKATVFPHNRPISPRSTDTSPSAESVLTPSSVEDPTLGPSIQHSSSEQEASADESFRPQIRCAFDLLLRCLRFMALEIPDSWELDFSARPLANVYRLPVTVESRYALPNSRLSKIQFGEHPSESSSKCREHDSLASSVVLSLRFSHLKYLLSVGCERVKSQLHEIVAERERRRRIVLQSESVDWRVRRAAVDLEWAEVGYEESVVSGKDGRNDVSRMFTGIYRTEADRMDAEQQ